MELTQEQITEIKNQLRAEMEAENQKAELDRSLNRAKASAGRIGNSSVITDNYGGSISDNAHTFGALLWDEMDRGLTGTSLEDDGMGTGEGYGE